MIAFSRMHFYHHKFKFLYHHYQEYFFTLQTSILSDNQISAQSLSFNTRTVFCTNPISVYGIYILPKVRLSKEYVVTNFKRKFSLSTFLLLHVSLSHLHFTWKLSPFLVLKISPFRSLANYNLFWCNLVTTKTHKKTICEFLQLTISFSRLP